MPNKNKRKKKKQHKLVTTSSHENKRASLSVPYVEQLEEQINILLALHLDTEGRTADYYHAVAESMNKKGAIRLALLSYQKALSMAIRERDDLRMLLSENRQLQHMERQRIQDVPGYSDDSDRPSTVTAELPLMNSGDAVQPAGPGACIDELASELTPDSALQVIAGLDQLVNMYPEVAVSAEVYNVKGRAYLFLGRIPEAVSSFKAAFDTDPQDSRHAVNYAGALVAAGRNHEATLILKNLYSNKNDLSPNERKALLGNLASAESRLGNEIDAIKYRHEWLIEQPNDLTAEGWLEFCRPGLSEGKEPSLREASIKMLKDLHSLNQDSRPVIEVLAKALEDQGDLRESALLYRDLLRPQE